MRRFRGPLGVSKLFRDSLVASAVLSVSSCSRSRSDASSMIPTSAVSLFLFEDVRFEAEVDMIIAEI